MQSAGRRALSTLASKLHPPLPLTPRESEQLLQLLTTSFRTHLDREHPINTPETGDRARNTAARNECGPSSHGLATQHIDSILTHPLLAHKPQRRVSESAAVDVIRNPLGWFLDQVALGTANIAKAAICLHILRGDLDKGGDWLRTVNEGKAASAMADWLQTSGVDTSKEFLDKMNMSKSFDRGSINSLVPMLLAEGNQAPLWRWFTRSTEQRMEETGLDALKIQSWRMQLLSDMVNSARAISLDLAFSIFLRAHGMAMKGQYGLAPKVLQPAGARIANQIIGHPKLSRADVCSVGLYDAFLLSTSDWRNTWSKAVRAMLYLRHPTKPSADPGLAFIKDPKGASFPRVNGTEQRRRTMVQLCLGVAQQLLAEERFSDAQVAMNFAKEHYPDFVLSESPSTPRPTSTRAKQEERRNLDMLNRLLPT
ncbi:hypothetical protein K458DRAFT_295912 [Lentithecium fluviatile CBS 122367]|uniref:Uncharacterized protein n=1 Tax=Lentithecium fluviatile CBS 122367 TaxID=1168545 RepID=A0A6G1J9Z5_9PLEO|nr:hypothetical protein K458DRAFT_295912 [Lentithecium fluviatile CBS 122367]